MASIRLVPEEEATGKVKEIYEEIKAQHGIDFVPNLYRAMAANPSYLEANWRRVKAIMSAPGKQAELLLSDLATGNCYPEGCLFEPNPGELPKSPQTGSFRL